MNYKLLRLKQYFPIIWFAGVTLLLFSPKLKAENSPKPEVKKKNELFVPPVFLDPIPSDITISCLSDFPVPIILDAEADDGTILNVPSVDSPPSENLDPCLGGIVTRTWTATFDGETTVETQTITVEPDSEPPVLNIPEVHDTILCTNLDASNDIATWINDRRLAVATNAMDVCTSIDNIFDNDPQPMSNPCNTITMVFTIVDDCGAVLNYESTYTLLDTVAPVLDLAPNDTIVGCNAVPPPAVLTATDDCSPVTPVLMEDTVFLACNYEYTITRTWIATDSCMNADTAVQIVMVIDTVGPVLDGAPEDDTLRLHCDELIPNVPNVTVADNCDPPEFTFTQDTVFEACPLNYTINRFWFVDDGCGRSDMGRQTIIVTDTIGPQIIGVGENEMLFLSCADPVPAPNPNVVADDNCSVPQLTYTQDTTFGVCQYEMTIFRQWVADDGCGRTDTARQTIVITDDIGPEIINAPENDTVRVDCTADIPILPNASVQDNCGTPDLLLSQDTVQGACPQELMITRIWTTDDGCGRTDTARQVIFVLDTIAPVLIGVAPADTILLDCNEIIPDPPFVTATDNCIGIMMPVMIADTVLNASCPNSKFTITRRWTATDDCENFVEAVQVINVDDNDGPNFTVPPNITIDCTQDPSDLTITGDVTDISDNCDDNPIKSFSDNIIQNGGCPQSYQIQRRWRVRDACNNITGKIQIISVVDNEAPDFDVPPDVTVSCGEENDFNITGLATNVIDNCDQISTATFFETIILGPCVNSYTVIRTWSATDNCGNFTEKEQIITVVDNQIPLFTSNPQNLTVDCDFEDDLEVTFNSWITDRGGALAVDNCSNEVSLAWFAFESGTSNPAVLPEANCPAPGGLLREAFVDFVVVDECGNQTTQTARFRVIDNSPPIITGCPSDTVIQNTVGLCEASYTFFPPSVQENCAEAVAVTDIFDSAPITATVPDGGSLGTTPIDPITLNFDLSALLPLSAGGDATLTIDLTNADAEGTTEYLLIYGEDGSLLGQTNPTNAQCGSSQTTLNISAALVNIWGNDGIITINIEPFIPVNQSVAFAVNAICDPQGLVAGTLSISNRDVSDLEFEYQINADGFQDVAPIAPQTVTLPVGMHTITYRLRDCGGNTTTCSYQINVIDLEAPILACPIDTTAILELGDCTSMITLPRPTSVTDNCGLDVSLLDVNATNSADSLLTFAFDPNLPGYLAEDKTYNFPIANAGLNGDVYVIVDYLGDFNTNDAFFTIKGEGGEIIGVTDLNVADCSTPNQQVFTIPAPLVNTWSQDGSVDILAESQEVMVPGGQPGDGVNPCNPANVNMDGDDDGASYLKITLAYDNIQPDYFTSGVTNIPFTEVDEDNAFPAHEFDRGVTQVSYVIADIYGNIDTCEFEVTILDEELPTAICQPTILEINPSGLSQTFVDATAMDNGSFDNCGGLDTLFINPNGFDCSEVGTNFQAELVVRDSSGNENSCTEVVSLVAIKPEPVFSGGACAGDTLFLFANPPATPGVNNDIWTYQWSGPNFSSGQRNPFIPNVGASNAGTYSVTVTGISGCSSFGELQIGIENLPPEPEIFTAAEVCNDEQIVLSTNQINNASSYLWYQDVAGATDLLLGETDNPELVLNGPLDEGDATYYLIIETSLGCLSNSSDPVIVNVVDRPEAIPPPDTVLCEGEELILSTSIFGVNYEWSGPTNFFSTQQSALVTDSTEENNHSGVYNLIVARGSCVSDPVQTVVTILPKPAQPDLFSNGTLCEGEELILTTTSTSVETYQWLPPNGPDIEDTDPQYTVPVTDEDIHEGTWQLIVTQFGCKSDPSEPVMVNINPVPNTVGSASDLTPCEGTSVDLIATPDVFPAASYVWEAPSGDLLVGQEFEITDLNDFDEGQYILTITSPEACTKSDTINIDVLPGVDITALSDDAPECLDGPTNVTLSATIFPPDLSSDYTYLWSNGNGFSDTNPNAVIPGATSEDSDNYSLQVTNSFGCVSEVSTIEVELTESPATPITPVSIPINVEKFCEGDEIVLETDEYDTNITYFWTTPNGPITTTTATIVIENAAVSDSGAYTVYVEEGLCPSNTSGTKLIDVNPVPIAEAMSNGPICAGDDLVLTSPIIPNATYEWSPIASSLPTFTIASANPDVHAGTYSVVTTLENCMSEPAEIEVEIFDRPDAPVILNNGPICISDLGASLQLSIDPQTATPGASYTWTGLSEIATLDDLILNLTNFTGYDTDGTYEFFAEATLGICTSEPSEPTSVVFNIAPDVDAMINMSDTTNFCLEDIIILDGTVAPNVSGAWTLLEGNQAALVFADSSLGNTSVTIDNAGFYNLQWSLSNGACIDFSTAETVLNIGEAEEAIAGDDFFACYFQENLLDAVAPDNPQSMGFWTQPDLQEEFDIVIVDSADVNSAITGLEEATYAFFWNVMSECGSRIDTVFVTLSSLADGGDDLVFCDDFPISTLGANPPSPTSKGRWTALNTGVEISNPSDPMASVINLNIGENRFVWTIDDGICEDVARDTISRFYYPLLEAVDDNVVITFGESRTFDILSNDLVPPNSTIKITIAPNVGSVVINDDGTITYTPGPNYRGEDEFTYEVCNNGQGCDCVSAVVSLSLEGVECKAPSIITPNNDGVNDTFVVPCLLNVADFPRSRLIVFNRWGDEVYRSGLPYDNNWDGQYNGEDLPVGTYFYVLEFGNGAEAIHGFVVIQR